MQGVILCFLEDEKGTKKQKEEILKILILLDIIKSWLL